eukprot:jgi/Tetstr1/454516/TSEL_041415.t1
MLLAGGGSGYCHGGMAAGPRPERPTACPTTPAPRRHPSRPLGGLLGRLGRGLRATALVDVVAGESLRGGQALDRVGVVLDDAARLLVMLLHHAHQAVELWRVATPRCPPMIRFTAAAHAVADER